MSPELGGRRSPEAWSSPHDRARVRLAERMTEPLEPAETAWLDAHLADCSACRELDAAYRADRDALRALRVVPPPRDLWARTSAALDAEGARSGRGQKTRQARQTQPSGPSIFGFPHSPWARIGVLGSIAAVMVVGFLVGNQLLATPAHSPVIVQVPSATATTLVATPVPVPQADVAWVSTSSDGSIVVRQAPVANVCPPDATSGCAPIDKNASNVVTLSVKPKSVHQSPTSGQMIVFGQGPGTTGLTMYVIDTGLSVQPTPTPSAKPAVTPSSTPSSPPPSPSPTPGGSSPSVGPASGSPTPSAPPTTPPATATPSTPGTSPSPTVKPTANPTPTPTTSATPPPSVTIVPGVTPPPSAAALIAVASGVGVLNAETAAYSPDGAWFAFTGRSLALTSGSDIYLWHAGDAQATVVTTDHRSVFAAWAGGRLVGSVAAPPTTESGASPSAAAASTGPNASGQPSGQPSTSAPPTESAQPSTSTPTTASAPATVSAPPSEAAGPEEFATSSFLLDPTTLDRTTIATPIWRPAVDPTGRFVVYWEGTVAIDPASGGWLTATGRLVIAAWPAVTAAVPEAGGSPSAVPPSSPATPGASGSLVSAAPTTSPAGTKPSDKPTTSSAPSSGSSPSVSGSPASTSASTSPSPAATATPPGLPNAIASASGVDWAAVWDVAGTHLAVWIGDRGDRTFGHLSLLTVGGIGAQPIVTGALFSDRPALPGVSLAAGHLAWATPPGVDGIGSQLQIYAYSGADIGVGSGQGQPGTETVIVVQN